MSYLEHFSKEERDLIVALPYRVGLMVSNADETGGIAAAEAESEAMEYLIEHRGQGSVMSKFVAEVMSETQARKNEWHMWGEDLENVFDECKRALEIIDHNVKISRLSEKAEEAYRMNLMAIATEVAVSFREFSLMASIFDRITKFIKIRIDNIWGGVKGTSYESETLINVSYEEDVILSRLSEVLRMNVDGRPDRQNQWLRDKSG
jgi:hypothetical protein